uniref:Uncharacterized protein n=1 Tax=Anopheles atroparvus TaxID=41427 RepID=A0A182J5V2_ANOAO
MNPQDFDIIGKHVYENVHHINHILGKAKFSSKFSSNDANADLPGVLLALAKEEELRFSKDANLLDPRPCEEEIDTLFETIRSNSTTASKVPQRQGSFKKTAGIPLQQSRILNETNLVPNGTMISGSCSDLSALGSKASTHSKQPPVDVEALVRRFRETIDSLAKVENRKILSVDLTESRQHFRSEWTSIEKTCRNVEAMLDKCKQQLESNAEGAIKQEPIISSDLIKSLKKLQTNLHYTAYIQKAENLPDLSRTLSKEVFPLSEYLDSIDETIRQKQL